ncbi:MAG: amidophosphoribosyltransferase [Candidatus Zixiibacteriota bacterium]|nr:MAG: amidophosphoribosyltransferase [candidate division Zixibacteria bacterium]
MNERPEIKEHCGCFGIFGHPHAAELAYLGLFALQHRGQEAAGIVTSDGSKTSRHVGLGLVADVFADPKHLQGLKGHIAIGHNRYSTTGSNLITNAQPLAINYHGGPLAIAHNGNLTNSMPLRRRLESDGSIFQSTTDSEVILHLIARSRQIGLVNQIREALTQVEGAFSLVFLARDRIIAARDPHGFRPLCVGMKDKAPVVASESCALDLIEAEYVRDVEPGEILEIDESGLHSSFLPPAARTTQCIFEFIYFSRPDSRIFGEYVDKTRRKIGKALAREKPVPSADLVISVPDSSNSAALGYSQAAGLRFDFGLIRNHYIGRTFIHPTPAMRDFNVRIKFNTVGGVLRGKRVVVVDDSIVRGTTLKKLTRMIRTAGAAEVHVRIASPPVRYPCFYGMDFGRREDLIAAFRTVEEIRDFLDVDSLEYLSVESLLEAAPKGRCGFCTCCFTGDFPTRVSEAYEKFLYESDSRMLELDFMKNTTE